MTTPSARTDELHHDGEERQYVVFGLADDRFAFDLDKVREIIRIPDTVRVPLTPPAFRGLANLRGIVLPVLDLRRTLNLSDRPYDDSTRVVVTDCGHPLGLVVDRVERVMQVKAEFVDGAEGGQGASFIEEELLAGVIRDPGGSLIQLIDVARLVTREFAASAPPPEQAASLPSMRPGSSSAPEREEQEADVGGARQFVSFLVDGQEYGLDITVVEEIVRVPERISSIPQAGAEVLGMIDLRGRTLPLLSLRHLLGMPPRPLTGDSRVLVLSLAIGGMMARRLGLAVDQVCEVLRVAPSDIESVPPLLSTEDKLGEITAICRLDQGQRLVSVLDAERLIPAQTLRETTADQQGENAIMTTQDNKHTTTSGMEEEMQIVVFQLAGQEYGVPIAAVQEITRIPEELSRVPRTPAFIEGLMNLRGAVLPVLDMRTRFGLERQERNDRQRILVLEQRGVRTGYIVDAVSEVLRLNRGQVEEAPPLSADQARIMGRVANLEAEGRMIQVIDERELLSEAERRAIATAGEENEQEETAA